MKIYVITRSCFNHDWFFLGYFRCLTLTALVIRSINPFNPLYHHNALKHHFRFLKTRLNFPRTMDFKMKNFMKLVYQYMTIFFNFSSTSSHLHPLQVENCDSNSRLVVDEDDNDEFRLERVNIFNSQILGTIRVFSHQDLQTFGHKLNK